MAVKVKANRVDRTPPTSKWVRETPAAGSTLADPILKLRLAARDNRGVARVEFFIEGASVGNGTVEVVSNTTIYALDVDIRTLGIAGYCNVRAYVHAVEGPGAPKNLGTILFATSQVATLEFVTAANTTLTLPWSIVVRAIPATGDAFLGPVTEPQLVTEAGEIEGSWTNNLDGTWTFNALETFGNPQSFDCVLSMRTVNGNFYEDRRSFVNGDYAATGTATVGVSVSDSTPDVGQIVTVTPTVSGIAGTPIVRFDRQGDGSFEHVQTGTAPFTVAYTSQDAPGPGNATVTAVLRAEDPAGQTTAAQATVVVTIAPLATDTTAPVASFTSPADGATISGVETIGLNATDAVGVVALIPDVGGVERAEIAVSPSETNASRNWSLDTRVLANGAVAAGVKARDAAGNVSARATRSFTVSNAAASPGTPPTVYTTITTAKFDASYAAGDWISPIGIAPDGAGATKNPRGVVPAARFAHLWARSQAGNWSYIQTEQPKTWAADGSLKHCTGHFKIPAGYVAGEKVDIVMGLDGAPPATPTWSAVTNNDNDGDMEVDVSVWRPKVFYVAVSGTAAVGDVIRIRAQDGTGEQVWQRTVRSNRSVGAVMHDLALELTMSAGSRFRAFKDAMAKLIAPPPDNDASPAANDYSFLVRSSWNASSQQHLGSLYSSGAANARPPWIPAGHPSAPVWPVFGRDNAYVTLAGQFGFYLWQAWNAGNPEDFACTVEVVRASGSTLSVRTGPLATDIAESGTPFVVQTPQNRVAHTLTFAAATPTPRSPYFNGAVLRQAERKVLIPGTTVDLRMSVSFDSTGAQVDAVLLAENSRMFSGARDAYYDVTAIRVNGVNQLDNADKLAAHRDLHHTIFRKWSWAKTKPWYSVDTSALMRSDLIPSYVIRPADDNVDVIQVYSRGTAPASTGSNYYGGDNPKINPLQLAARGGFENAYLNKPLWSGPLTFDGGPGARPGIALHDICSGAYLSGNHALHWEDLVAVADNCWGAFPWYVRDERPVTPGAATSPNTVDADQADSPPHPYKHVANALGWDTNGSAVATRGKGMIVGSTHFLRSRGFQTYESGRQLAADCAIFSLYQGCSLGSYSWFTHPTPSHSPPHAAKVPYVVRPESRFLDALEQWAWANYSVFCGPPPIKTGGAVYDADHRASWSVNNGVRGFSWPWRDVCHAAALMWEGHPRREMFRRWAGDGAEFYGKLTAAQWGGLFHTQSAINSNNWNTAIIPQKPGNISRSWTAANLTIGGHDLFKSAYCTQVAAFCHQAEIADLSVAITQNSYFVRALDDTVALGKPWHFIWGLWNNHPIDLVDAGVTINLQNSTQAATFTVGEVATVATSGFSGTVHLVSAAQVTLRDITNWTQPLAGQAITTPAGGSGVIVSLRPPNGNYDSPGFIRSINGRIGGETMQEFWDTYDAAPWAYYTHVRWPNEPVGDSPFGLGSSTGYSNECFHWKSLYAMARFGTDPVLKARAQYWIDFLNARYPDDATRDYTNTSNVVAFAYDWPPMRFGVAIGLHHIWRAPEEIASQAW